MVINPMSLDGRTILVTGAGQGIGRGIAEISGALGARVVLCDMNEQTLAETAAAIGKDRTRTYVGSVADAKFVEHMVDDASKNFGPIDGLVNNAGITRPAMITKMTTEQWDQVIAVNLTGVYLCLQAVGKRMIDRHKSGVADPGAIVNVSSDAGLRGTIGQINYGAAKSGVLGISMSAAREWARYNIRVNSVCFGVVITPMTNTVRTDKRFAEDYLSRIPLGRFSTPEEVAKPVCFLLSSAASYITGQYMAINGGMHIAV
ncbi:MAG: SDR family NAD(P)-dependent oxidoreductase [Alphaproteobacteria bacterium]